MVDVDLINFNFDDLKYIIKGFLAEANCCCSFSGLGSKIWKYQVENTQHRLVCSKKNTVFLCSGHRWSKFSKIVFVWINPCRDLKAVYNVYIFRLDVKKKKDYFLLAIIFDANYNQSFGYGQLESWWWVGVKWGIETDKFLECTL